MARKRGTHTSARKSTRRSARKTGRKSAAKSARKSSKHDGADSGVKPIPDGYRTVTPYLVVRDVARLIQFLEQAFGATEVMRTLRPDGSVMHAELSIGDSRVMMAEASDAWLAMPACIHLYVVDTDALY